MTNKKVKKDTAKEDLQKKGIKKYLNKNPFRTVKIGNQYASVELSSSYLEETMGELVVNSMEVLKQISPKWMEKETKEKQDYYG